MLRMHHILLLLVLAIATRTRATTTVNKSEIIVTTTNGQVRGVIQNTISGRQIYSFKGMRYVKAPIGELRFKPPVPIEAWEGVYDATKDGPACPQPNLVVNEDCLFINVHTPKLPRGGKHHNKKYPVIVFVHPGSFTTLTGTSAFTGPDYLLDHDVVLVSFNYRLAALGFLSTGDELAPGNNGMKDQVEALRWVKKNIAAFGGDPDNVVLSGYSVGGVSVSIHLLSPMSRGLFHKVMIMSGSVFGNAVAKTELLDLARKQARLVNCPDDTSANIIDCLKKVPAEDLGNSLEGFRVFSGDPQFFWQMVIEPDFGQERFLIEDPTESIRCGRILDVPVFTGITKDELIFSAYPVVNNQTLIDTLNENFREIAPLSFNYESNTSNSHYISDELKKFYFSGKPIDKNSFEPLGELYADALSGYAVNRGARLLSLHNKNPVYYYIFTYKGRFSFFNPPTGNDKYVVHFDDIYGYVVWNSAFFPRIKKSDPEYKVVKAVTALWSNFAWRGNPTPFSSSELSKVHWDPFTVHNKKYLDIGERLVIKRDIYPKRYAEWDRLFPLSRCST